jgi:hypothetical protein
MQTILQSLRKVFSVIFPAVKGDGKCKIGVCREIDFKSRTYRFVVTIESGS